MSYRDKYPHLFQNMVVNKTVFKNRILAAPTHHSFAADPQDCLSERGALIYAERARGGAASVTIGEGKMDLLNSAGHTGHISCFNEASAQRLLWFTELVHTYGAVASIEFNHAGQYAIPEFNPGHLGPMGASACLMPNGLYSREMTEKDMEQVAESYANACATAKRAEFDMVTIHMGHGWLLGGFLSPLFNHRTDMYGGSLENRVRFPKMVLHRIRERVGKDFIIEVRMSGDELVPGGMVIEDCIDILKMIRTEIDMAQISCGTRLDPVANCMIGPDHFTEPCHNEFLSQKVKQANLGIPIGVVGNITKPEDAERLLSEGKADYIVMARSWIADPDWGSKVKDGEEEEIRPCIKCSRCGDMMKSQCSVNPTFGYASLRTIQKIPFKRKKVVVIGGGVAGMQAAIEASERGHECVLLEKKDRLGGQLFYSDYVWFKREMRQFRDYLIRQLTQKGVTVYLNTEATEERVLQENPDAIITAVGADPLIPPIPGVEGNNVVTALALFGHESEHAENLIIIGGGMVGCELALHLASLGKTVTLVEMGLSLAPDAVARERTHTLYLMDTNEHITSYTGMKCTAILQDGIEAEDVNGERRYFKGTEIVLASGMKPKTEVRDRFAMLADTVIPVGDCVKVSNVMHAVSTGYSAGLII